MWAGGSIRPATAGDGQHGEVLLWPDTFRNNLQPAIARAAVEVLEDAGFRMRVPDRTVCCGLTRISTGQLGIANRVLRRSVGLVRDDMRAGTPVVVLEPSCAAVFRADAPELRHGDEDVYRLARSVRTAWRGRDGDLRRGRTGTSAATPERTSGHVNGRL